MDKTLKVHAIGNALSQPAPNWHVESVPSPGLDTDDLVDRFESLMGPRDHSRRGAGEHSRLVSVIDGLAEDGLTVAAHTDAVYNDKDAPPEEVALRTSILSNEMRLVGLQLKAFSEMSKQSREGVQTLIRS
jgi:hypothetical protein